MEMKRRMEGGGMGIPLYKPKLGAGRKGEYEMKMMKRARMQA